MTLRRMACGLIAVLALGSLAACTSNAPEQTERPPVIVPGGPGESASTLASGQPLPPAAQPNAADVLFMSRMVAHHQQALDMAALVPERAASDLVKGVAARIADSQRPEIDTMNAWLKEHAHAAGHDGMEMGAMPGMATPAQVDALRAAKGADFDALFLKLMIVHHQGAVTMSQEIQNKGSDVRVQEMADEVIAVQSAEINRMQGIGGH
jgi:uncharacterized protein (DUF305 family)